MAWSQSDHFEKKTYKTCCTFDHELILFTRILQLNSSFQSLFPADAIHKIGMNTKYIVEFLLKLAKSSTSCWNFLTKRGRVGIDGASVNKQER